MDTQKLKQSLNELLVLAVIDRQDMYGYSIETEIRQKSNGIFQINASNIYSLLYRLEENGIVSSRNEVAKHKLRRYYYLEEKGKQCFESMKKNYLSTMLSVLDILEIKNIYQGE